MWLLGEGGSGIDYSGDGKENCIPVSGQIIIVPLKLARTKGQGK